MFISLDLETTGFDKEKDRIIEFGAIKFDLDGNTETLQILINPQQPIPEIVSHITNIYDKDVENAPTIDEKIAEITEFIGDLPIIGHNIQFDTGFLRANGIPLTNAEYDTCQMTSTLLPGLPSYSLEVLTQIFQLTHAEKHRALDDAIAAMQLFLKLIKVFENIEPQTLNEIKSLVAKSDWPLKELIKTLEHKPSDNIISADTEILPQLESIELPENFKDITTTAHSALYEFHGNYQNLVHTLSQKIHPDSYIALPYKLFRQIESRIPNTLAKIDAPNHYLSPQRLETFKQQPHFTENEIQALIKYIVWQKNTKTGLLSEIKLFFDEKETTNKVCINPEVNPLEKEPFYQSALKKDEDMPAICTHEHIIQSQTPINDLILIDFEKFNETLHFELRHNLTLKKLQEPLDQLKTLHPENQSLESLIRKAEMFFGVLSLFFENYNDASPYGARAWITPLEIQGKEWHDLKSLHQGLLEISQELGTIKDQSTIPYLTQWKKHLQILHEILYSTDLTKNIIWIEDYREEINLISSPISIKEDIQNALNKAKNYKIVDRSLDQGDDGAFIKDLTALPHDLKIHSALQKSDNLNIFVTEDVQDSPDDRDSINFIKKYVTKYGGNTAIIVNSRAKLQSLTLGLSKKLQENGIGVVSQLTGSLGKISEMYQQDPEKSVILMTPHFWEQYKDHHLIDRLIIHKIPFDPPSDPYILSTSKNYQNAFMEFQVPRAVFKLRKSILNLQTANPQQQKEAIILDNRLITKRYGQPFMHSLRALGLTETAHQASLVQED